MKCRIRQVLFALIIMVIGVQSALGATDPVGMLQSISNRMIAALKANKATMKNNPKVVVGIVNRIMLPHVDVVSMSRSVLGRTAWMQATSAQRAQFIKEFKTLVIRTYASALASYSNETVQFAPLRGGVAGRTRVQVDSKIIQPGGPPIPVSYRMVQSGNKWKVYDVIIEGVSLVQSYRSQFANVLSQKGLPGLLKQLSAHNARNT